MRGCTVFLLLLSSAAWAASYAEELDRMRAREHRIDFGLSELGIGSRDVPKRSETEAATATPILRVYGASSELRAPAGKLLFGKLWTRLWVGTDESPVIVVLDEGQGIFSGLRALGRAHAAAAPGRIQVDLDRIIARGGRTFSVQAVGLDEAGALGLQAQVLSGKGWAIAGALASSFISGVVSSQQTLTASGLGFSEAAPSGRNALLQGTAQTAADQSKRFIEDSTQEKPVLVLESQTPISIYLEQEVRF